MSRITKRNAGWVIAVSILGALLAVFIVLYAISSNQNQNSSASLENIYEKNFYDLVDNINNTENKLAKAINATDENMQAKYLREVSINAMLATTNLNNLPAGTNEMAESVAFVNQLSGYTETLSKNLEKGKSLSTQDAQTLEQVYDSVLYMKNILAEMNQDMW
ncbi:MAG: germination protein YpeB, partial [Clostridia bacterium]|nr:germination protein YpeB [Clostridia bacterium]